jgi:hypothetical protein
MDITTWCSSKCFIYLWYFRITTAVIMKIRGFWDIMLLWPVNSHRHFTAALRIQNTKNYSHVYLCNPHPNKSKIHPVTFDTTHSNLWTPPAQSIVLQPTTRPALRRYINRANWIARHTRTLTMEMEYIPGMFVCLNHIM